jgi:hypothetical protein
MECCVEWENDNLRSLAARARRAEAFYARNPGLVGSRSIMDLYATVARLAALVERDHLAALPEDSHE